MSPETTLVAPFAGTVVSVPHGPRQTVSAGTPVAVGAMGLEGAVKLGLRHELEAIEDPHERQQAYDQAVAAAYERGRGISMASYFEIDDVIDPADTRRWVATLFDDGTSHCSQQPGKRRPFVGTY